MEVKRKYSNKTRRIQTFFSEEDWKELNEVTKNHTTQSEVVRKAIKILIALQKEEVYLTTPKGERIPNSIIF
jgi:hypothetical protein